MGTAFLSAGAAVVLLVLAAVLGVAVHRIADAESRTHRKNPPVINHPRKRNH